MSLQYVNNTITQPTVPTMTTTTIWMKICWPNQYIIYNSSIIIRLIKVQSLELSGTVGQAWFDLSAIVETAIIFALIKQIRACPRISINKREKLADKYFDPILASHSSQQHSWLTRCEPPSKVCSSLLLLAPGRCVWLRWKCEWRHGWTRFAKYLSLLPPNRK